MLFMNYGKVSESVFERTVYKTIQTIGYHEKAIEDGAGLGADCAVLPSSNGCIVSAQGYAAGKDAQVVVRALQHAANRLAGFGVAVTGTISIHISLPEQLREAKLRGMLEAAAELSAKLHMPIVSSEVHVVPGIQTALANVYVQTGAVAEKELILPGKAQPEQDVVMTKWMGLEGTSLLAAAKLTELETRYPQNLVEEAKCFDRYLSIIPEAATAAMSDVSAMQVVREGGIFGALWELAQSSGVGLVIDLKKISVKQETIEVCEYFDINPYKLLSGGSLLITTDKGMNLVSKLQQQGISAAVIGKTTQGNDRIITNEEETRYLEPAREDELYKVLV